MKKAVILFNLGGPDSKKSIEPFLFNLFNDPEILSLPSIFRYPLAKLISKKRRPIAEKIYSEIGGSSPILKLTIDQSNALEKELNLNAKNNIFKCFVVMRCWNPRAKDVVNLVKKYNPDEIILLPLYPQYSPATSGSSIKEWVEISKKNNLKKPTKTICCYPTNESFITSHTNLIKKKINNLINVKIIFSAHGLPERNIKKGDPYQWQIEQSVKSTVENLRIKNLDWVLSYQSRVGPLKWIGPSTDDEIIKASKENKTILLVPIAFVSEHSETLVELDIEYKKLAEDNGCTNYHRVPALGTDQNFIKSLYQLIINTNLGQGDKNGYFPPKNKCPNNFKKCPCSAKI
jgi:protoporphyrin/coproporphyrin ferrochelatase